MQGIVFTEIVKIVRNQRPDRLAGAVFGRCPRPAQ